MAGLEAVQIRQAAIGGWHVLALDATGQCWAWGEPAGEMMGHRMGWRGRGHGHAVRYKKTTGRCVAGRPGLVDFADPMPLLDCFPGGNEYGQCLAHGDKDVLRPVRCLNGINVKQVAAGGMHSLALTEDGQVRRGWAVGLVAKRHHVTVGLASVAWLHLRSGAGCALPGASKIGRPAVSRMPARLVEHATVALVALVAGAPPRRSGSGASLGATSP